MEGCIRYLNGNALGRRMEGCIYTACLTATLKNQNIYMKPKHVENFAIPTIHVAPLANTEARVLHIEHGARQQTPWILHHSLKKGCLQGTHVGSTKVVFRDHRTWQICLQLLRLKLFETTTYCDPPVLSCPPTPILWPSCL